MSKRTLYNGKVHSWSRLSKLASNLWENSWRQRNSLSFNVLCKSVIIDWFDFRRMIQMTRISAPSARTGRSSQSLAGGPGSATSRRTGFYGQTVCPQGVIKIDCNWWFAIVCPLYEIWGWRGIWKYFYTFFWLDLKLKHFITVDKYVALPLTLILLT